MKSGKKSVRLLTAVLSAAALSAWMAGSSFAAGWTEQDGSWYYLNSSDAPVTDSWKDLNGYRFYLGNDGVMQKDALIQDDSGNYYYVNGDGAMVKNSWRFITAETDGGYSDADNHYYYFGANGQAYKRTADSDTLYKKQIDGNYYAFDEEGRMLSGWVNEEGEMLDESDADAFTEGDYYFGEPDDGKMLRAQWMEYMDATDASSNVEGIDYDDYGSLWLYFDANGKKYSAPDTADTVEKTVNGYKYSFDQNGVMLSSFVPATAGTATQNKYFSSESSGYLKKNTWIYAIPTESMDPEDYEEENYRWFYAGSTGKLYTSDIKKINGKKYLFDELGRMRSGFVVLGKDDEILASFDLNEDELSSEDFLQDDGAVASALAAGGALYYFGNDEETDGSMKTGKSVAIALSDDTWKFGFDNNGKAYGTDGTEAVSGKYYKNGLLLAANADDRYAVLETADGSKKVVGTNGSVSEGSHRLVKDGNDCYLLIVDDNYYAYVEDEKAPVWYEGQYYYYDADAEGKRGDVIEADEDGAALSDQQRLNF